MNRRQLIKVGGSLGALAAAGWWGRSASWAPAPGYVIADLAAEKLGEVRSERRDVLVRDAAIAHVKAGGLTRGG